jgi:hypothetical protein
MFTTVKAAECIERLENAKIVLSAQWVLIELCISSSTDVGS